MKKYGIFAFILSGLLLTATNAFAECGDGTLDNDEQCDGTHFREGKDRCDLWDLKYGMDPVKCDSTCHVDLSACVVVPDCGNGKLETYESCDGNLFLGGRTDCSFWDSKYTSGTVSCNASCGIDFSKCTIDADCGNGKVDNHESCDGDLFSGGKTQCSMWGYGYISGTMKCSASCELDDSGCKKVAGCGNNQLDKGEVCDTKAFGDATCKSLLGEWYDGVLACDDECSAIDTSGCFMVPACGNAQIDRGETCDGDNHNNVTCESIFGKWYAGSLVCKDNCHFDVSGCEVIPGCGNKILDEGESCDGDVSSDVSCASILGKWYDGTVSCDAACGYDTSDCKLMEGCGNGILDYGERCDGILISEGVTCESLLGEWYEGTVECTDGCGYDTSKCTIKAGCGNGIVDDGEDCEDGKFPQGTSLACSDWSEVYGSGNVKCVNCQVNFDNCKAPAEPKCGDGRLDPGEPCDGALFLDNIYSCSGWDSKYVRGNVSCHHCTIDYSECVDKQHAYEKKNDDDDSGCAASPLRGAQSTWAAWLLGLFGVGILLRRRSRKESK